MRGHDLIGNVRSVHQDYLLALAILTRTRMSGMKNVEDKNAFQLKIIHKCENN